MSDRRQVDDLQGGPKTERRMGDRRDSHRVPIKIEVSSGQEEFSEVTGDLGIGGVYFAKPLSLPTGADVRLRFVLPGVAAPIDCKAQVIDITSAQEPKAGTRVRFVDLDIQVELEIARFLDEHADPKE